MNNWRDLLKNKCKGVIFIIYLWTFLVGGTLCVIGQLLIDYTKLTAARVDEKKRKLGWHGQIKGRNFAILPNEHFYLQCNGLVIKFCCMFLAVHICLVNMSIEADNLL